MDAAECIAVTNDATRTDWVRLNLRGRVTVAGATRLHDLARELGTRGVSVSVDCREVEYLDVAVLQVLIALGRDQVRRGKQFDLAGVPSALKRLLCVAGLGNRSSQ